MAGKDISKTTKRAIDVHEVTNTLQGKYEITSIQYNAPYVEPIVEVQG